MTAGYIEDWDNDSSWDEDGSDLRIKKENMKKQLFTVTLETVDLYDEGDWTLNQVISVIEGCDSGIKVLDVAELPSKSTLPEIAPETYRKEAYPPARKPRT